MRLRMLWTDVQQISTTPITIPDAKLGGTTLVAEGNSDVYVWCDAVFRVRAGGSTAGFSLSPNKAHYVGTIAQAKLLTFESTTGTPDMRILVCDGEYTGV